MNNIKLNINSKEEFTLNGDENKKIYFNPNDVNIFHRYKGSLEEIAKKQEEYKALANANLDNNDVDFTLQLFDKLKEIDALFKEKLDYIFDSNISEVIFGNSCCLSLDENGELIFKNVLDTLLTVCTERLQNNNIKEIKEIKNKDKVKSYLNKYNKHRKNVVKHDFKKSN